MTVRVRAGSPVTVVRLVRNLAGHPFAWRASAAQTERVRSLLLAAVRGIGRPRATRGATAVRGRRAFGLLPHPPEGPRPELWHLEGGPQSRDDHLAALVNAVDHLVLEVATPGLDLDGTLAHALRLAARLERRVAFARTPHWGWLAASPADCGSGARVLVRLPVAGLRGAGMERDALAALARAGLAAGRTEGRPECWEITHRRPLGMHPLHMLKTVRPLVERLAAVDRAAVSPGAWTARQGFLFAKPRGIHYV